MRASGAQLKDALSGQPQPVHRNLLTLYLQRLDLIETQIAELEKMIAEAMKAHEAAIVRLSELPGLGVDSAQQIIAEIGPSAAAFPSAGQLASWVGVCPGSEETAGKSNSNRSAKGNRAMRRLLDQLARHDFAELSVNNDWLYAAALLAELIASVGNVGQAEALYQRLAPTTAST